MASDLFAAFTLRQGKRTDFDFDARPWLTGTAVLTAFVLEQDPADPVVYEAPSILAGGKDVKVFASVAGGAAPGPYRVAVSLTDNQGRTDRQWFQMRVE